jgi:arsenate reductase (glutaredoxin)
MQITLYGIPNCDTVKKARTWLEAQSLTYAFHDYKKAGIAKEKLAGWSQAVGWEKLLNRAGTTFKSLPESDKTDLSEARAIALMLGQPSMIKRPVVEHAGGLLVGFKEPEWAAALR